jgi:SAM-dependent methyltransferase
MLQQAHQHCVAAGCAFPVFARANARQLPFAGSSFDAVMSIRVLHLFPSVHWGALVDEMIRVLKPGGTLLVEFDSPFAGFGWAMIRELRWRRQGLEPRYYFWPQHLRPLFAGLSDVELVGFWFPGIGWVAQHSPRIARVLLRLESRSPFGYLANRVLIRARKPSSSPAVQDRGLPRVEG